MEKNRKKSKISDLLERLAGEQGLIYLTYNPVVLEEDFVFFEKWLENHNHAEMRFMENNLHCRKDPKELLKEGRSILSFGFPYYQGDIGKFPREAEPPRIAQYARLRDYHKTLRKKLEKFTTRLKEELNEVFDYRIMIDSAPLLERSLAGRGAKGFIGKNTCFIQPHEGSWLILSELMLSLDLSNIASFKKVDASTRTEDGGCGTCKRCQVHCPTGALAEDFVLDARKCISYYTIEHRGVIPVEYWQYLPKYLFGCDICQLVCPYNRDAKPIDLSEVYIKETPDLFDIVTMDQRFYEEAFGGTPVTRAKKSGLKRNALIAMFMNKDKRLEGALSFSREEKDPLVLKTIEQMMFID